MGVKPLYAYGHEFELHQLRLQGTERRWGETITASFTVKNTGKREGADVPQICLTEAAGEKRIRPVASSVSS
jgi:beta-glucosidase